MAELKQGLMESDAKFKIRVSNAKAEANKNKPKADPTTVPAITRKPTKPVVLPKGPWEEQRPGYLKAKKENKK